ncbi:MAG: hypothetical protein A3J38_08040 [Gammaproteobacteria bacterium RIFCSPHIGHO2_12_FULL_45_9]|nr:MAG: hypothetical protein A3J38_08040 [Gammaproteobacteria bacterium RIFCSPHIGHO2_12_FULL_45_9]
MYNLNSVGTLIGTSIHYIKLTFTTIYELLKLVGKFISGTQFLLELVNKILTRILQIVDWFSSILDELSQHQSELQFFICLIILAVGLSFKQGQNVALGFGAAFLFDTICTTLSEGIPSAILPSVYACLSLMMTALIVCSLWQVMQSPVRVAEQALAPPPVDPATADNAVPRVGR